MADLPAPKEKYQSKFSERKFVRQFIIRTETGHRYAIPADVDANRAAMQLRIGMVGTIFDRNLKLIQDKGIPLDPNQMKDLVASAEKLNEAADAAYTNKAIPSGQIAASSDFGRMAAGMIRAATEGAVSGAAKAEQDRMGKILSLGKRQQIGLINQMKKAEIVEEPKQEEQPDAAP